MDDMNRMEFINMSRIKKAKKDMTRLVSKGIKDLWQQGIYIDYCIKCENQEFRAHKLVLAAGSDYFRTMLTSGFKESSEDSVDLKSISAIGMTELLNYLYTSEMELNENNCSDILAAAVHLQVQPAIDMCCQSLMKDLNLENCLGVRQLFRMYQLEDPAEEVEDYIFKNANAILESEFQSDLSFEEVELLIDHWYGPRWNIVLCIKKWITFDSEQRYKHLNALMLKVMFTVLPLSHLEELVQMDIYTECSSGEWKDEIINALNYFKLPIWKKVARKNLKFNGGPGKQLFVFTTDEDADTVVCGSELYTLMESKDRETFSWCKKDVPNVREDICKNGSAAVVNNFLVVAGGYEPATLEPSSRCYIFDVTDMKWTQVGNMITQRLEFPLVKCRKRVYALGGCTGNPGNFYEDGITSECEVFDFTTNTWARIPELPRALRHHSACSVDGIIYVSGGLTCGYDRRELRSRRISFEPQPTRISRELDTFDPSTNTWKSKAPMIETRFDHSLIPVILDDVHEVVIMAIGKQQTMEYYVPSDDQWTRYIPCLPMYQLDAIPTHGTKVARDYDKFYFVLCAQMFAGETSGAVTSGILNFDSWGEETYVYKVLPDIPGPVHLEKTAQFCSFMRFPHAAN